MLSFSSENLECPVTQLAKRTSSRLEKVFPKSCKTTLWNDSVTQGNETTVTLPVLSERAGSIAILSRVIGAPPNGSLWQLVYAVPLRKLSEESQVQPSKSCCCPRATSLVPRRVPTTARRLIMENLFPIVTSVEDVVVVVPGGSLLLLTSLLSRSLCAFVVVVVVVRCGCSRAAASVFFFCFS